MNEVFNISEFKSLTIPQKIDFLNGNIIDSIQLSDEKSLNVALRSIVLDSNENSFVRKNALKLFTELVFIGKLKKRHALSLLIDDWSPSKDVFLELQRLKDLLLYYEESNEESEDIESVFKTGTENSEAEIVGESLYNLGIISFQKALRSPNEEEFISALNNSDYNFQKSIEEIENRVDSKFYQKFNLILRELLSHRWGSAMHYIIELGNNLFQKEAFSLKFKLKNLQYGFYKILTSLQQICIQQPKHWIDYRLELDNVFLNFTDITNSKITSRLNEKELLIKLGEYLKGNILEPYFAINLSAEITKIDVLLRDKSEGTPEYAFLQYLKTLIEKTDKKKVEFESLEFEFKKLFPNRDAEFIAKMVGNINSPYDCFKVYQLLSLKTNEKLLSDVVFACTLLQSDKNYWGDKVDENERNKYVANLLIARDYSVKDQTQWSKSSAGKKSGEIDIFISEIDGTPKSIIEALNLNSLRTSYIIEHLDKLFDYDTTGLECNFILTYSTAKDFKKLWDKYIDFIAKHQYKYDFISFKEIENFKFTDIKIGIANHMRNEKVINLYHLMINLTER